jgi:hypothetical protein
MTKSKAATALLDAKRQNEWTWDEVAAWAGLKNKGMAWGIAHGEKRASRELKLFLGVLPVRRRPVNWYRKHQLLARWVRRQNDKKAG